MYLDPSFGGMFIQILIAVLAGGGAILFGMRRKIKAYFSRNKKDAVVDADIQNSEAGEVVDMLESEDGEDK